MSMVMRTRQCYVILTLLSRIILYVFFQLVRPNSNHRPPNTRMRACEDMYTGYTHVCVRQTQREKYMHVTTLQTHSP
jgi:hypothetical protein